MNDYSSKWFDAFAKGIDPTQTIREVDWIASIAPPSLYTRALDLCCGLGRHAHALCDAGYDVTGLDRDIRALSDAKADCPQATFIAGDMRDVAKVVTGPFDLITILWQSFGYFDAATNLRLLRDLRQLLRSGGILILDVYDASFFARHLGSREFNLTSGERVREEKSIHDDRLIVTLAYETGLADQFDWQVFTPDALSTFVATCGFVESIRCTGFDPTKTPNGTSPRMQFVFSRSIELLTPADDAST